LPIELYKTTGRRVAAHTARKEIEMDNCDEREPFTMDTGLCHDPKAAEGRSRCHCGEYAHHQCVSCSRWFCGTHWNDDLCEACGQWLRDAPTEYLPLAREMVKAQQLQLEQIKAGMIVSIDEMIEDSKRLRRLLMPWVDE